MTAPMPLFGQIHQFALHGIASYPPLRQAQGRLLHKMQVHPQFRIGKKMQKCEKTRGQTERSANETVRPDTSNIQAAGDRGR